MRNSKFTEVNNVCNSDVVDDDDEANDKDNDYFNN